MSLANVKPELRPALSGIAALISLFPTLIYFLVFTVPGLEVAARKPEIFYWGLRLFGAVQILAFLALCIFLVLLWRPDEEEAK